ncbi:MAG TPA: hypothetical protein VFI37_02445 [Gaiellaceae bacterium]|jgi:hypothetical protein|nr:hypothetical protein [Gaiellaceae bacterium]
MTTAAAASIPAGAARRLGRRLPLRHPLRVELVLVLGLYGVYAAMPIVLVIVATGDHFLLDAAAGALVFALAAGITGTLLRRPAAPDRLAA